MGKTLMENRGNVEAMVSLCAANLTVLGRLFVRDGRYVDAREVLALAAKLGSLEALAEIHAFYAHKENISHYRIAG